MDIAAYETMTREYDAFLDTHAHLADFEADAFELLTLAELTASERAWLEAFCDQWLAL